MNWMQLRYSHALFDDMSVSQTASVTSQMGNLRNGIGYRIMDNARPKEVSRDNSDEPHYLYLLLIVMT